MDIDDFLDREATEIETPSSKSSAGIDAMQLKESIEPSPVFEDLQSSLSKGDLDDTEQKYIQLWHLLAQENFKWDKLMYEHISELSRQISSNLAEAVLELNTKEGRINDLLSKARLSLKEGKKDSAMKLYKEVQSINNSIPDAFFEEKKKIQDRIILFYQDLKSSNDEDVLQKIKTMVIEINLGIEKINALFQKAQVQDAIVEFSKCLHLYNQVPEGFLRQKHQIGVKLLEIYKNISIFNEISNLQKQLSVIPHAPLSQPNPILPMGTARPASKLEGNMQAPLHSFHPAQTPRPIILQKMNSVEAKETATRMQPHVEPKAEVEVRTKPPTKSAPDIFKEKKIERQPARQFIQKPSQDALHAQDRIQKAEQQILKKPIQRKKYDDKIDAIKEMSKNEPAARSFSKMREEIKQAAKAASEPALNIKERISSAKKNFERGLYNEASKDVEAVLNAEPADVEAKALYAKIKAWQ